VAYRLAPGNDGVAGAAARYFRAPRVVFVQRAGRRAQARVARPHSPGVIVPRSFDLVAIAGSSASCHGSPPQPNHPIARRTTVRNSNFSRALLALAGLLFVACGNNGGTSTQDPDQCSACLYHTLVWADEFDGTGAPDPANWSYDVGAGWNGGANMFLGWGNWELEWYRPEQAVQQNGNLVITADYDATREPVAGHDTTIRSARLVTQGKQSWSRARIEARIALPNVAGTWPAFWLMGDGYDGTHTADYAAAADRYDTMASTWPSCGEIDIMEHKNTDGFTFQNVFWDTRTGLLGWNGDTIADDPSHYPSPLAANLLDVTQYHVYGLEWTDTQMFWYVDGRLVKNQDISKANQEELNGADRTFFILLNLAIGGPGTPFTGGPQPAPSDYPLRMYVDWVRVYQ
jgi:beta-glucanase (GH16 family)